MEKYVYAFNEGDLNMRHLLGGKGANLAEMTKLGLPVPSGFTLTTKACDIYYENNGTLPENILHQINMALGELEAMSNKKLGDTKRPLLLSVRSGAVNSMPGMMDTVLNIGLNDEVVLALAEISSNPRFVYDSYRRFISMYADVVDQVDKSVFENILTTYKNELGLMSDQELTTENLQEIIRKYKLAYEQELNKPFSNNSKDHLIAVILSVFRSWNNPRAITYRELHQIDDQIKTAVNIQEMVMGNMNEQSATGVVFSRNPSTGEKKLYGEFLLNAQGEDIVAGVRTPLPIEKLKTFMPDIYHELENHAIHLEAHFKDMQDMEFTIENGKLFMLQTRNGKRSGIASIKIAMDLLAEKLITKKDVINRITIDDLNQSLHAAFEASAITEDKILWHGLAASPGAASGKIYFSSEAIANSKAEHKILVRSETSADDILGMKLADAIVTGRGGMTSHAAVVARGMGKVSVTGCETIIIDEEAKIISLPNGKTLTEGDEISVDGTNGIIYQGILPQSTTNINDSYYQLIKLLNEFQNIDVVANAETETDLKIAINNGASGVGLCRTEHMFFEEKRLNLFKKLIINRNPELRQQILLELEKLHTIDFVNLFKLLDQLTITIRYLDPPFHEFLPREVEDINDLARELNIPIHELNEQINKLKEVNPMMGERGAHLLVTNPDILIMQTKAIAKALKQVNQQGVQPQVKVMLPLVSIYEEAIALKKIITDTLASEQVSLKIGAMIETPRAAIIAHHLAPLFDFYSFGTNDLTQLTYGISRDDANRFLPAYLEYNLMAHDPFISIDQIGVGALIKTAINNGKKLNRHLSISVCGEHAGDPTSFEFFKTLNIDALSCSAYRIPLIKLMVAKNYLSKE